MKGAPGRRTPARRAVADLTGVQLDFWTATALGLQVLVDGNGDCFLKAADRDRAGNAMGQWRPSTDWLQAGPLMVSAALHIRPVVAPARTTTMGGSRGRREVDMPAHTFHGKWFAMPCTPSETDSRIAWNVERRQLGDTPQEAICRAVVAAFYGSHLPPEDVS